MNQDLDFAEISNFCVHNHEEIKQLLEFEDIVSELKFFFLNLICIFFKL